MIIARGRFRLYSKVFRFRETYRSASFSTRRLQTLENNPGALHRPRRSLASSPVPKITHHPRIARHHARDDTVGKRAAQNTPTTNNPFRSSNTNIDMQIISREKNRWPRHHHECDWRWGGTSPVASRPASRSFATTACRNTSASHHCRTRNATSISPRMACTDPRDASQATERHPYRSMSSRWSP